MPIPDYVPNQADIQNQQPYADKQGFHNVGKLPPGWRYGPNMVPEEDPAHKAARLAGQLADQRNSGLLNRRADLATPTAEAAALAASRQRQLQALALQQNQAMGQGPSAALQQQRLMQGQSLLGALGGMGGNGIGNRNALAAGGAGLQNATMQGSQAQGAEQNAGIMGWAKGAGQLRGGDLNERNLWQQQLERDRKLQLGNAQTNWEAVKGLENLDADRQARLRNQNLKDWDRFYANQGNADAAASQDEQASLGMAVSLMSLMMMSDRRNKKDIR